MRALAVRDGVGREDSMAGRAHREDVEWRVAKAKMRKGCVESDGGFMSLVEELEVSKNHFQDLQDEIARAVRKVEA